MMTKTGSDGPDIAVVRLDAVISAEVSDANWSGRLFYRDFQ